MSKVTKQEKKTVKQHLLEFRKTGLKSYGEYLANELKSSEGNEIRKAYSKYLKKELAGNDKRIAKVEAKLIKLAKPKVE